MIIGRLHVDLEWHTPVQNIRTENIMTEKRGRVRTALHPAVISAHVHATLSWTASHSDKYTIMCTSHCLVLHHAVISAHVHVTLSCTAPHSGNSTCTRHTVLYLCPCLKFTDVWCGQRGIWLHPSGQRVSVSLEVFGQSHKVPGVSRLACYSYPLRRQLQNH